MRIDKWLWVARFFKTRALAQAAVNGGRVKIRDERVKPSKELKLGDELTIQIGEYAWRVTVKGLSARRGPAEAARGLYEENEESRARRIAQVAGRRAHAAMWDDRKGRPTKRERRQIHRFIRAE